MPTQSQKNSEEIIKLQGEVKLIHQKLTTIKDNHLAHLEKKVDNVYKFLWVIATISMSSLINFIFNLLN
jgi:hypothetical protein